MIANAVSDEFKTKILLNKTNAGFNIYHQAGMTLKWPESRDFLEQIKSLLAPTETQILLNAKTKNGFTPRNKRNKEIQQYLSELKAEHPQATHPGSKGDEGRPVYLKKEE